METHWQHESQKNLWTEPDIKQTKSTYAYQTDRGPQSEIWEKGILEEQGLEEYHTV